MTRSDFRLLAAVAGIIAAAAVAHPAPADAASVTFGYGSLANNATDAQIQSYMNTEARVERVGRSSPAPSAPTTTMQTVTSPDR